VRHLHDRDRLLICVGRHHCWQFHPVVRCVILSSITARVLLVLPNRFTRIRFAVIRFHSFTHRDTRHSLHVESSGTQDRSFTFRPFRQPIVLLDRDISSRRCVGLNPISPGSLSVPVISRTYVLLPFDQGASKWHRPTPSKS
jgi:hypothetical protein